MLLQTSHRRTINKNLVNIAKVLKAPNGYSKKSSLTLSLDTIQEVIGKDKHAVKKRAKSKLKTEADKMFFRSNNKEQ